MNETRVTHEASSSNIASPNRRNALASGAAAAAWCATLPLQGAESIAPQTFVLVSDTHLGRKDSQAAERNWRKAIDEINHLSAACVFHLGDIVDGGRAAQYPIYAETRKLLNKPIHEIPGNHDPLELFQRHVAPATDRAVDLDELRFLLFNNARRDSHDGFISQQQIEWLRRQCASAVRAKRKIVICCHVPIHANTHPDRGWYVKPKHGQNAFYDVRALFSEHVLACFHGHFHNGIRGWRDHDQTVEALLPSVCYNQNRNLEQHLASGKADGFFVDELRPGFVIAKLGAGELKLSYKPLGVEATGKYAAHWA